MAGYRTDPDANEEVSGSPVRGNLKGARAYGCLFAVLLSLAMSFVVLLGIIMGDCDPGPGCHDNDGFHIMQALAVVLPIAAILGIGMWLLAASVRALVRPMMHEAAVRVLLVGLTITLVWVSFGPAFEAFFRLTYPVER